MVLTPSRSKTSNIWEFGDHYLQFAAYLRIAILNSQRIWGSQYSIRREFGDRNTQFAAYSNCVTLLASCAAVYRAARCTKSLFVGQFSLQPRNSFKSISKAVSRPSGESTDKYSILSSTEKSPSPYYHPQLAFICCSGIIWDLYKRSTTCIGFVIVL